VKKKFQKIISRDYLDILFIQEVSEKQSFCHSRGGGNPGFKAEK